MSADFMACPLLYLFPLYIYNWRHAGTPKWDQSSASRWNKLSVVESPSLEFFKQGLDGHLSGLL